MATDKRLDQVKLVNSAESVLVVNGDQVEKATLAGFANSMGSSVPLQQTSEQVNITGLYARTSDGKMVELTKESVASVVAEQMNNVEYEVSSDDAVVIAQEVVSKVTSLMFNVIANGSTRSLVSGYVYPNKLYGLITVSKYDGSVTIVTLNNGSFTKS